MRAEHGAKVRVDAVDANPWNDNRMNAKTFEKERRSIREFGFVDPVTVRPHPEVAGRFQIIDGEHRWLASKDEGLEEIPATILHDCSDRAAKKLTVVLNRLRGQPEHELTAALLADLARTGGTEDLVQVLPYDDAELRLMLDLASNAWDLSSEPQAGIDHDDPWTTLKVRVPKEAVGVIERALKLAGRSDRASKETQMGLGLERIAADFLAGAPQPREEKTIDASASPFVVLGCGDRKREGKHRAVDLYTGPLFSARLAYAEKLGGPHAILSAKLGLVSPSQEVETYDLNISQLSSAEADAWSREAAGKILAQAGDRPIVLLLAGKYLSVEQYLPSDRVVVPARGLPLGKQIQALRALVAA